MTDKEIETLVKNLSNSKNISEQNSSLLKLNELISKRDVFGVEKQLYQMIKNCLSNSNVDVQKCALTILCTCLTKGLFKIPTYIDIAYIVIDLAFNGKIDNADNQELWLKTLTALEYLDDKFKEICEKRSSHLISILSKSLNSGITSALQKVKALSMFNKLITYIDVPSIVGILPIWLEQIFPLMFSSSNPNVQNAAMELSYNMLPSLHLLLQDNPESLNKICSDIKEKYIPDMNSLIKKNNCIYAKLWIFLIKLLGSKFYKDLPAVNLLLSVIETAFKSQNLNVRSQAFYCWQALIECFALDQKEICTKKRLNLLIIPLKTNNCKTEDLVKVKYQTWLKLINVLASNEVASIKSVIAAFLNFSFGPMSPQTSLLSYTSHGTSLASAGKKYPSMHLMSCKALLQLIGRRKYIDDELKSKLTQFEFDEPIIGVKDLTELSKIIIDSVGESCVLLSQLENCDRFECCAINEALWLSLFSLVDSITDEMVKSKVSEEVSSIVLSLVGLARKKQNLINFGLVPLFNIITSGEFDLFKDEKMSELLFMPMVMVVLKKDRVLLQHDVVSIFKKIFIFKRDDSNYLQFIKTVLNTFAVNVQDNTSSEKLAMLHQIWFLLYDELGNNLSHLDNTKIDSNLYIAVFHDFFIWPISTMQSVYSKEKLITNWKFLYNLFGDHTSGLLRNKLASLLIKDFYRISKQNPVFHVAYFVCYIIKHLELNECTEDNCNDVFNTYCVLKDLISLPNLTQESFDLYQNCLCQICKTKSDFPFIHRVLQLLTDCLKSIPSEYLKDDLLSSAKNFVESLKYNEILEPELQSLMAVLNMNSANKSVTTEPHLKLNVATKDEKSSKSDSDKEQRLTVLGYDLDKMTPVKLKGSMLKKATPKLSSKPSPKSSAKSSSKQVAQSPLAQISQKDEKLEVFDSPYKFDPKKLTKSQREKMSRRRDDIPALYQDLSQSQSQNMFSASESYSEPPKNDENQAVEMTPKADNKVSSDNETRKLDESDKLNLSRPFSEFNVQENTTNVVSKFKDKTLESTESDLKKRKLRLKPAILRGSRRVSTGGIKKNLDTENKTVDFSKLNVINSVPKIFDSTETQSDSTSVVNNIPDRIAKQAESDIEVSKSKPMKIQRGSRRKSTGCIKKTRVTDKKIDFSKLDIVNNLTKIFEKTDIQDKDSSEKIKTANNSKQNTTEQLKNDTMGKMLDSTSCAKEISVTSAKKSRGRPKSIGGDMKISKTTSTVANLTTTTPLVTQASMPTRSRSSTPTPTNLNEQESILLSPSNKDIDSESEQAKRQLRVQKELMRIKIDVNDGDDYKNKTEKRRTRTGFSSLAELVEAKPPKIKTSPPATKSSQQHNTPLGPPEKLSVKPIKLKLPTKSTKVSLEKEIRDSEKPPDIEPMEVESEPIIDSSQEEEITMKPCKVPALYRLDNVKPGEQIVIADGNSKMDLVKGPKESSPFKITIKKSPISGKLEASRKISFSTEENSATPSNNNSETSADETRLNPDISQQNSVEKIEEPKNDDNVSSITLPDLPVVKNSQEETGSMPVLLVEIVVGKENSPEVKIQEQNAEGDTTLVQSNDLNASDTQSVSSEMFVALNELDNKDELNELDNKVELNQNNDLTCRKVLFDTSISSEEGVQATEDSAAPTIDTPVTSKPETPGIVTSPVSSDTPTRNKEFMRSTLQISPIKILQMHNYATTENLPISSKSEETDNNASPELFSGEPSASTVNNEETIKPEVEKNTPSTSSSGFMIRRKKSKFVGGRSAQMMDLVSANSSDLMCSPAKKKKPVQKAIKSNILFSPQNPNRIMKMMEQFGKNDNMDVPNAEKEEIREEDIFTFSKTLPSPCASPAVSILKKRKMLEEADDGTTRSCKRRRVNFSDPPVSCRKYIEKNARNKFNSGLKLLDFVPQETRVTRSVKEESENGAQNASQEYSEPSIDTPIKSETTAESNNSDPVNEDTKNSGEISFNLYDDKLPICPDLVDSTNPITDIILDLTTLDFIDPLKSLLTVKNIITIGDLAKLTELQVYQVPLKVHDVRFALEEHIKHRHVQDQTPTKPTKKITPITICVPEAHDTEQESQKSCEVSVITSPIRSKDKEPIVFTPENEPSETTKPNSDSIFSEPPVVGLEPIVNCSGNSSPNAQSLVGNNETSSFSVKLNKPESVLKWSPRNEQSLKVFTPSPTSTIDNILNEEIGGMKVNNALLSIIRVLNEKKHDPKPILNLLSGGIGNLAQILVSMGTVKVHHLTASQKWDKIIEELVTHMGIWKVMKYLGKIKTIPSTVMMEALLKYNMKDIGNNFVCDRLERSDILKYCVRAFDLIDIMKEYDQQIIYRSLRELSTANEYSDLKFKEILRELYSVIIENPQDLSFLVFKLSVVEIGDVVINRMADSTDMDAFLEKIYKSVPFEQYMRPVPETELNATDNIVKAEQPENYDSVITNCIQKLDSGSVPENAQIHLWKCIARQMSLSTLADLFASEIKKKVPNPT